MTEETQRRTFVFHQEALAILATCSIAVSSIFKTIFLSIQHFRRQKSGLKQQQTKNGKKHSADDLMPHPKGWQMSKKVAQEARMSVSTKGPIQPNMSEGRNYGSILQNASQRPSQSRGVLSKDSLQDSGRPSKAPSPFQMNEADSRLSFPRKSFQEATSWAELDDSEDFSWVDIKQEKSQSYMSTSLESRSSLLFPILTEEALADLEFHFQVKEIQWACGGPSFVQDSLNAFAPFPPDFEEDTEESLNETSLWQDRKEKITPSNHSFCRSDMADGHTTLTGDSEMHPASTESHVFLTDKVRSHILHNHRLKLYSPKTVSMLAFDPLSQSVPKHIEQRGNRGPVPICDSMGFETITQVISYSSPETKECLDANVTTYGYELPKQDQQSLKAVPPLSRHSLTHDGQAPFMKSCQRSSPQVPMRATQRRDDSDDSIEEDWLEGEEMEKLDKKSEVRREARGKTEGMTIPKTSMFLIASQEKREGLHTEPNRMRHEGDSEKVGKKGKEDYTACGYQAHKMSGAFTQKEARPSSGSEGSGRNNSGCVQGRETTPRMVTEEPFFSAGRNQFSQATQDKCSKDGREVSQREALEDTSFQRPVKNVHPKQTMPMSKCFRRRRHLGKLNRSLSHPWAVNVSCWLETLPGLQWGKYPNAKTTWHSKDRKTQPCFSTSHADESHDENNLEPACSPEEFESNYWSLGNCEVPKCQCASHVASHRTISLSSIQSLAQQGGGKEKVNGKEQEPKRIFSSLSEEKESPQSGSVKQGEEGSRFQPEGNGAKHSGLRDATLEGSPFPPEVYGDPNPALSYEKEPAFSFLPSVDNGSHISDTSRFSSSCERPRNVARDNITGFRAPSVAEEPKGLPLGSVSEHWHNWNPPQLLHGSESAADGECQRALAHCLLVQTDLFVCLLLQLSYTYTVNRILYRNESAKVDEESVGNSKLYGPFAMDPMSQFLKKCNYCGGRSWLNREQEVEQIRKEEKGKVGGEKENTVSAAVEEIENEDRGNKPEGYKKEPSTLRNARDVASEPLEASQLVSHSPSSASQFREPQSIFSNPEMYKKTIGPPSGEPEHVTPQLARHAMSKPQVFSEESPKHVAVQEERLGRAISAAAEELGILGVGMVKEGTVVGVTSTMKMKTQHRDFSVAPKEEDLRSGAAKKSLEESIPRKGPSTKQKRATRRGELLRPKERQSKEAMRQDRGTEDNTLEKEQFALISRILEAKLQLQGGLEIWKKTEGMSINVCKTKTATVSTERDASSEGKARILEDGCNGERRTLGEPHLRKAEACTTGVPKLWPVGKNGPMAPCSVARVAAASGNRSGSGHDYNSHGRVLREPPVCPTQLSGGMRPGLRLQKVDDSCRRSSIPKKQQKGKPQGTEKPITGECSGTRPLTQHGVSQGSGRTRQREVDKSKEVQLMEQSKECRQPQNKGSRNGMEIMSIIQRIVKAKLQLFARLKKNPQ